MIKKAVFLQSSPDLTSCPLPTLPEFAFIGRSNVGKSSLVNMLVNNRHLARVSSMPGKTRHLVFFTVNDAWRIVDLPGYGYAKVSKPTRGQFNEEVMKYLRLRENLHCLFVLLDCRLEPQRIDMEFIRQLGEMGLPFALVFTKTDKISRLALERQTDVFRRQLSETWEELPPFFCTSSKTAAGRDDLIRYMESSLNNC